MMVDYVDYLLDEGKDLSSIAIKVHAMYDRAIKGQTTYYNVYTGETVEGPEWPVEAITTHLATSRQWPEFRDAGIGMALFSMVQADQEHVIDPDTGRTIPDVRRAVIETSRAYAQFRLLELKVVEQRAKLAGMQGGPMRARRKVSTAR
jgi:hypothetical protein